MALLRSEHCGNPDPHRSHNGRLVHHLAGPGPHLICDGDPDHRAGFERPITSEQAFKSLSFGLFS